MQAGDQLLVRQPGSAAPLEPVAAGALLPRSPRLSHVSVAAQLVGGGERGPSGRATVTLYGSSLQSDQADGGSQVFVRMQGSYLDASCGPVSDEDSLWGGQQRMRVTVRGAVQPGLAMVELQSAGGADVTTHLRYALRSRRH